MNDRPSTVSVPGGHRLHGSLRVPGDKSVSHRALLLAALAKGRSTVHGLSSGLDVVHTRTIIEALGAATAQDGDALVVTGGELHEPTTVLDVGNSGTGIRLLAGLVSGLAMTCTLTGDSSVRARPMERITIPLRLMGARIDGREDGRLAPLTISGGALRGIDFTPPMASAQVKSAVLLAGVHAAGQTVVREPVPTRRHTEEMLRERGVSVITVPDGTGGDIITLEPGPLSPGRINVPGDPSQAAFWICAAAALPGSDLSIEGLYLSKQRSAFLGVLLRMGADLEVQESTGTVHVAGAELRGTIIEPVEVSDLVDEIPALAVAAALAVEGSLDVRGAAELRTKESDRIDTTAAMLHELGGTVETWSDRLVVHGGAPLHGGTVYSHGDHRIAMAAAVAACGLSRGEAVTIDGWNCVATSYPGFLDDLTAATAD